MSHSTTGTSSFLLCKYSRSYPSKRTNQKVQTPSQNGPEWSSDWQHFTNPVIRLVLDVKTTSGSEIESVKLRILWEINSDQENGANSQDVVFEDLDLLSFTALASGPPRKNQTEGLPLKAVYRDTVVGIRYLHSREEGTHAPVYRRFQISFQVAAEANEFIRAIQPICPCKLNPVGIPASALSQIPNPALQMRPPMHKTVTTDSALSNRVPSYACPPPSMLPPPTQRRDLSVRPSMHETASLSVSKQTSSSPLTLHVSSDSSSFLAVDNYASEASLSSLPKPSQQENAQNTGSGSGHQVQLATSRTMSRMNTVPVITQNLPSSSLSSLPSSDNSLPVQRNSSEPGRSSQNLKLIALLEESASVYNMPNSDLEKVICEIIHEDGFVQLVERVSDMLMVQTLLNT